MSSAYKDHMNPPIPKGYHYVEGEWNNGFVIARDLDESEFVWIPVYWLDPYGTTDGIYYDTWFGRRNWYSNPFCKLFKEYYYEDTFKDNFITKQNMSVQFYGGFYVSRYNISRSNEGKLQSKKVDYKTNSMNVGFEEALELAKTFEVGTEKVESTWTCKGAMTSDKADKNDKLLDSVLSCIFDDTMNISSHLLYGREYDSILAFHKKLFDNNIEQGKAVYWDAFVGDYYYRYTQECYGRDMIAVRGNEPYYYDTAGGETACRYYIPMNAYRYQIKYDSEKDLERYYFQVALYISPHAKCTYLK